MALIGRIHEVSVQAAPAARLQAGLKFVRDLLKNRSPDLASKAAQLQAGQKFEVAIDGQEVFAIFQAYLPRHRADGFFEAHREFTDIQSLLGGEEAIEVIPLATRPGAPVYDQNNNLFFPINEPVHASRFLLVPGIVTVLFPEDAHAPALRTSDQPGLVHKVVVKIRNALSS